MRAPFLLFCALWAGTAQGAVTHMPLKSGLVLKPDQAYTVTVDATVPTEIGWEAVQAKRCTMNCVQATEITAGVKSAFATALGASRKYTPASGRISIEYKNLSTEPVTINVYRIHRVCDAEACTFLDGSQKSRWLVFKVDEFTSITTSKDGSYSVISGVAQSGRAFRFKAVWWTDDKAAGLVNCSPSVTKYLDAHTPKDQYRPYVISGQALGEAANAIVLTSIDTCAAKAPNFGVPDKNVFK